MLRTFCIPTRIANFCSSSAEDAANFAVVIKVLISRATQAKANDSIKGGKVTSVRRGGRWCVMLMPLFVVTAYKVSGYCAQVHSIPTQQ